MSVGDGGAEDGVGADYRRIINVANGVKDNDAVTVAQLKEKADLTYVNDELAKKANVADVNAALDLKANASDVYTKTEADGKFATNQALTDGFAGKADKATTLAG